MGDHTNRIGMKKEKIGSVSWRIEDTSRWSKGFGSICTASKSVVGQVSNDGKIRGPITNTFVKVCLFPGNKYLVPQYKTVVQPKNLNISKYHFNCPKNYCLPKS